MVRIAGFAAAEWFAANPGLPLAHFREGFPGLFKRASARLERNRLKRYLRITKGNQARIDKAEIGLSAKYDGKWVVETFARNMQMFCA